MMKASALSKIVIALGLCLFAKAGAEPEKPNVVLIMADDVSWEAFGCYGAVDYETPNLDRLAAEGVRFEHCYSTPICTTSRVMLMTGEENFRNYTHFGYLDPEEKTIGHLMKEAGYKTAIAGKWQLSGLYNKDEFADHQDVTRPNRAGFDEYCLWQLTKGKELGERFWSPPLEKNGEFLTAEENQGKYGPDLFRDFICDFMERNREEPFFVYYPMVLVHDPFLPTPDSIGESGLGKGSKKGTGKQSVEVKKRNFVAMVRYMDKIVGQIFDKIDELGELENTLILFTADNGTDRRITSNWNGRSIRGGKGGMKNSGTHVPLIAFWKGQSEQGLECQDLVQFNDFYPTLAELAGLELDEDDPKSGQSFLPQVLGEEGESRQFVLCHYQPYWGASVNAGAFVRTERFKLYDDGRFYDVSHDLEEEKNFAEALEGEEVIEAYQYLSKLIEKIPPVPKGSRKSRNRPVHADWPLVK
ncbi:MAG: sulfatase-like hydrolase/transferase [Roseibacillus sp.]